MTAKKTQSDNLHSRATYPAENAALFFAGGQDCPQPNPGDHTNQLTGNRGSTILALYLYSSQALVSPSNRKNLYLISMVSTVEDDLKLSLTRTIRSSSLVKHKIKNIKDN